MDQYIVSARKYRPATFGSVVGQQSLTATLKNAIVSDRLAHAYLFCGGRGVGKTSCARIFAKTINCTDRTAQGEACQQCDSCRQFNEGRSLNIIELDAASHNGIDDIKGLIEQVMVPPTIGRYRVFIIDEVHMLTTAAFNAFLKTLEEPPAHAVFILATTEKHKILPTILSRCQIYDFNRISIADMVAHMQKVAASEGIQAEAEALAVIAAKADGAMRDALSIFDQVAAYTQGNITYQATIENLNVLDRAVYNRLLDAMVAEDVPSALLVYKEVRERGFDSQFFLTGLGLYLRDLMVAAAPSTASLIEAPESERQQLAQRAAKLHPTVIYRAMEIVNDADFNFRAASNKQFLVELTLIRLCQLLSPSSGNSGDDEGRLRPLKAVSPSIAAAPEAPQQAAQQPAAAPGSGPTPFAAAPAAPARRHQGASPASSLRVGTMSLRVKPSEEPAQAAGASSGVASKRSRPCSPEGVTAAWIGLRRAIVGEPILESVVEMAEAELCAPDKVRLKVATAMQAAMLEREKPRLLALLRDALENDSVDYAIVQDDTDLEPAYWPEKRVLDYMLEKHPGLADFIARFKLRVM